jgi:primosomal protein N'
LLDTTHIPVTKPITARLDPRPILTPAQLELAQWMSRTYLAPIGPCLWTLLPPGLASGRDIRITLLQPDAQSPDDVEQRLIALLRARGPLTGTQISIARAMQGLNWRGAVDRLVRDGVVDRERILKSPRVRPQHARTAMLAIHPNQITSVARHLGKESRRANLLEVLAAMRIDNPPISQVLEAAGSTLPTLKRLEEVGLVRMDKEAKTVSLNIPRYLVDEKLVELRGGATPFRVLQRLAQENGPLELNTLRDEIGPSAADLKHLEEDGLIILGEMPTWRDSLAARDFVPSVAPPLTPEQQAAWETVEAAMKAWDWEHATPPPAPPRTRRGEEESADISGDKQWHIPTDLWNVLKPLAKQKRREPTRAENVLWQALRRHKLGYPVRRQHPIERFIVDFYYPVGKLIIEVDGEIHQYTQVEDQIRQEVLETLGYHIIRFTNDEVINNLDFVVQQIRDSLTRFVPDSTPLSVYGEGEGEGLQKDSHCFLLHGVTGSGKTEIYLRAIELAIAQGRGAIFLVPEIALTAQTVRRVASRFPGRVAVVHSRLSDGERYDTWRRARDGLISVVVGARSALFTPLPDVGLIILDEEHDSSYKQAISPVGPPYYHARAVAEFMTRQNNGMLILGSATPDVETMYRAQRGDITLLKLPSRIMGHRGRIIEQAERTGVAARYYPARAEDAMMIDLPPVSVVDMRRELKAGNTSIFSRELQTALADALRRREQAILFLNRRGTSTYVFCRDCGYVAACPRCDTPLTHHQNEDLLRCHRCGFEGPTPTTCPQCGSGRIKFFGAGTQQVERALLDLFPTTRVLRWDADTASNPELHDIILTRFLEHKADVLVGTQMVAKGLDLPMVTLVGVVSADTALNLPDFRAGETTFQLLTQVAGRAGRGLLGGRVVLQTYQPEHYAIATAANHDFDDFYAREIGFRRELGYPPFRRLARVVFQDESEARARSEAQAAADVLRARLEQLQMTGTELIGPAPCFFSRVNNIYRWHLLLRGPEPNEVFAGMEIARGWHIDVDPADVL